MINENNARKFCCEDISLIENYDKAIADETQTWHLHHRVEIMPYGVYSKQNLIDNGLYWNVPAAQLIFLTKSEHSRLHGINKSKVHRQKLSEAMKGHEVSEDAREKNSAANRGANNPFFGKHHTEESRAKMRTAKMGMKWWNNGVKCVRAKECPPGFVPGRLKN